jgi:hypothetical protein
LITSTFLSLLVIPAVFTIVDDIPAALKWAWNKVTRRKPKVELNLNIAAK